MWPLLQIELYKLLRRPRSYISFGVMAIILSLLYTGLYLEGEEILGFVLQSMREQFLMQGKLINGYFVAYIALNTLWVHIPILIVIVTADLIPGEMESGTIRTLLTRPISRVSFVLTKFLAAMIYVMLFMLFLGIAALMPALWIFGSGDLVVFSDGMQVILAAEAMPRFILAMAYGALSMLTFAAISMLISVWLRSTLSAILATLGLLIISTLLQTFAFEMFEAWKPLLFTYHMAQWQLFFIRDIPISEIATSAGVLLAFIISSVALSLYRFDKIQITE